MFYSTFNYYSQINYHKGSNLPIQSANSLTKPLINGKNIAAINNPRPIRNGKLINKISISGTIRDNIANTINNSRNAASIGAANLKPAKNIAEPAFITPSVKTEIVGMLPAG